MKSRINRILLAAGAIMVAFASMSHAQVQTNLGALTPENAKGYLAPLPKALSATLNSALFQSASIPIAGLNLTVGVHAMGVTFGDDDKTYSPTDPPGFTSTSAVQAPTVVGSTTAVLQPGAGGSTLYHPGGLDLDQFVIAVPQIGIGSVLGTRAVVRWIQFDAGDSELGNISLFGVGVQHSLNRYLKSLPVDLAVGGMYQTFQLGDDELIDTKTFHGEVTASKKFLWLQPYVGVGYDTFSMEVNYNQDLGGGTTQKVNVKMDDENSAHFTGGVLLGLPMVKLHAEFDAGAETGAAVGLRFGLGN
jgi:hypothetical protein